MSDIKRHLRLCASAPLRLCALMTANLKGLLVKSVFKNVSTHQPTLAGICDNIRGQRIDAYKQRSIEDVNTVVLDISRKEF